MSNDLSEVFTRFVLDPPFREAFCTDPKATLEGYSLTEGERKLLLSTDHQSIELLGKALAQSGMGHATATNPPSSDGENKEEAPNGIRLPPVHFLVTIQPQAIQHADGSIHLSHSAFVKPVDMPPVQEPSIESSDKNDSAPQYPQNTPAPSPWGHQIDTPETKDAAKAVREASPEDRYDRLMDLISTMQGSTQRSNIS